MGQLEITKTSTPQEPERYALSRFAHLTNQVHKLAVIDKNGPSNAHGLTDYAIFLN